MQRKQGPKCPPSTSQTRQPQGAHWLSSGWEHQVTVCGDTNMHVGAVRRALRGVTGWWAPAAMAGRIAMRRGRNRNPPARCKPPAAVCRRWLGSQHGYTHLSECVNRHSLRRSRGKVRGARRGAQAVGRAASSPAGALLACVYLGGPSGQGPARPGLCGAHWGRKCMQAPAHSSRARPQ